jgi:hypothetical protein
MSICPAEKVLNVHDPASESVEVVLATRVYVRLVEDPLKLPASPAVETPQLKFAEADGKDRETSSRGIPEPSLKAQNATRPCANG